MIEQVKDKNQLNLTPLTTICGRHGELFRAGWPKGYTTFIAIGLECLLADPFFAAEVKKVMAGEHAECVFVKEGEVAAIEALLNVKPMCCRIPPDDLRQVLIEVAEKSGCWEKKICNICGWKGHGAKYRKVAPSVKSTSPVGQHNHVCITCVSGVDMNRRKKIQ